MNRHNGTNHDLESAIQNVICAADLVSGTIEAALTGETACYAFYKLLEEIEALRHAAYHAAPVHQPAATPDWTGSRHA